MEIKLLSNRVLVGRVKDLPRKSGLVVPTSEDPSKPQNGFVEAVGPGKTENGILVPMLVKVGDQVVFQYSSDLEIQGKDYKLMREDDIITVLS